MMHEQDGAPAEAPADAAAETTHALVLRPETLLMAEPAAVTPGRPGLPALIRERLPALWDGGRGPLARALVAGGLLALGSVAGRLVTNPPGALVPYGRGGRAPALPRPSRVEMTIETEIGVRTPRAWGRSTIQWRRERLRIVEEWPEG